MDKLLVWEEVEALDWVPLILERIKRSGAYRELDAERFGYYMKLLIESATSEHPGYLKADPERLWMLAGARTRQFFDKNCGAVTARFQVGKFVDGQSWMWSPTLLTIMKEQTERFRRRKGNTQNPQNSQGGGSLSLSSSEVDLKKKKSAYTETDFFERDLRKLTRELAQLRESGIGGGADPEERLAMASARAGITIERARHVLSASHDGRAEHVMNPGTNDPTARLARKEECAWSEAAWRSK